ncbi:hypothetical protein UNSWDHB_1634 [Dehalobacter sp. UNSWDHB]|nr:hypothetical protein DHBDCA_p2251 [Dehalobacter sp. DCA]AFV06264.1 hypothetical protein DCF50_p2261 [Dehalobacter sp. CF]EQB21010.1 hypothetical protein UNSWDHB_1634 [Dehalobacter sp. UNSWDHB]
MIVYLILTAVSIAVNNIYAQFGHGVRSAAMTLMFLYPLLGGALFYFTLGLIVPRISDRRNYRLFYNIYNSGIAVLTVGSLLKGILDIAGTASGYVQLFQVTGWAGAAAGLVCLIAMVFKRRELS